MVKAKKNFNPYKGNSLNQILTNSKFVEEFNTWRTHCQGVSGQAMGVKSVPTLYMFLKRHFVSPLVRSGSRNANFTGDGANELLTQ